MRKEFLRAEAQIELLESRGMTCDDTTAATLIREGYYAVINGYAKPFIDMEATRVAHDDRYTKGTEFSHVYALFCFDRDLRLLTFKQLLRTEGMLRSAAAAGFLEAHPQAGDYLDQENYSTVRHYLLGEDAYERNLHRTLSTLSRYAHEHEDDERGRDDVRLAHYRNNYDEVPLWVVFSDFSYGNLYHFLALMKMTEQEAVCQRIAQALSQGADRPPLKRTTLIRDVGLQVEVRNLCAHGERLHDAVHYGPFARMMCRYLTDSDAKAYTNDLHELREAYTDISPVLNRVLSVTFS